MMFNISMVNFVICNDCGPQGYMKDVNWPSKSKGWRPLTYTDSTISYAETPLQYMNTETIKIIVVYPTRILTLTPTEYPSWQARYSGEERFMLSPSGHAPASSKSTQLSVSLFLTPQNSGVCPFLSGMSTWAPWRSNNATQVACLSENYSLWGTTWDNIFKRDRKCVSYLNFICRN